MEKQKNTAPSTRKDDEKAVSRKLTPSELEHVNGGGENWPAGGAFDDDRWEL